MEFYLRASDGTRCPQVSLFRLPHPDARPDQWQKLIMIENTFENRELLRTIAETPEIIRTMTQLYELILQLGTLPGLNVDQVRVCQEIAEAIKPHVPGLGLDAEQLNMFPETT